MNYTGFAHVLSSLCLVATLAACGGSSGGGAGAPASSAALSSSSSSLSSSSSSANGLAAPQNLAAVAANGAVTLTWNAVPGATAYNIYYATEARILIGNIASFDDGTVLQTASSPRVINTLRNHETYYFVVTALGGGVGSGVLESAASIEISATPSALELVKQPSAQEVLVMELVNRARANPEAEAVRYGIGLNDGISGTAISAAPKPPLAHNLVLMDAARAHSQWMLDADIFSHTGINSSTPHTRMSAAGYLFTGSWMSGENIAWGGTTAASINLTSYALQHHAGLFKSPGHRLNILEANFRELGIGQQQGAFVSDGTSYLASILTQNFARSGENYYVTGVIYNDLNGNAFYDVGEGLSGINISLNGATYPAYASGAYTIPVVNGSYNLAITGAALGAATYHTLHINNANVKLDLVLTGNSIKLVSP
jgi:Cysteine-rich secretory protein family